MGDALFIAAFAVLFVVLSLRFAKALGFWPHPNPHTEPAPVQGRRTGLSEHVSPFGQTERRAERTLDRPPP